MTEKQDKKKEQPTKNRMGRFILKGIVVNFFFMVTVSTAIILGIYYFTETIQQKSIYDEFTPSDTVNLKSPDFPFSSDKNSNADDERNFRIAIAHVIAPIASFPLYAPFADYIGKGLNKKCKLLFPSTYLETYNNMRYGKSDIGFVCTYVLMMGERDFGMEMLAMPVIKGKKECYSYLIVHPSSTAKNLSDLKGKRFASEDILSTVGWLYPATCLVEQGENPNHFFSEHIITGSTDKTISSVASHYVDGAAIGSIKYEEFTQKKKSSVKIIQKSPPLGLPLIVTNPGMDAEQKKLVLNILLEMNNNPEGKKILDALGIDKFIIPEKQRYESVRNLFKQLESIR